MSMVGRVNEYQRSQRRDRPAAAPAWSVAAAVRRWPWLGSLIAAAVVDLVIGALRHFDFAGIEGFSTTNYGWLAFSLVGGLGLAWRQAKAGAGRWLPVRPLVAAVLSFVLCFVAVTVMALVFLPQQSLAETMTTDAPGRAVWVALAVLIGGCACELLWMALRSIRRRARSRH